MDKILVFLVVPALSFLFSSCMSSYALMSRDRPECIAAGKDSAALPETSVSTVCFPDEKSGESQDDSCFSVNRRAHWYFDHPYPPRYTVFYYRRFGACPPYTYYAPDCDCCRRAGSTSNSSAKGSEEGPIHETK